MILFICRLLDISQPLPYASGSFDVVHIRNLSTGIVNYLQLVERCARILRPGGLLVVTELEHFYVRPSSAQQTSGD